MKESRKFNKIANLTFLFLGVLGAVLVYVIVPTPIEVYVYAVNTINTRSFSNIKLHGEYKVKDDNNTYLILRDDLTYELSINSCEGHVKLEGEYEISSDDLMLLNNASLTEYETLNENEVLSFTIIDNKSLKLKEDLLCVVRETLFEL